ncbi:MAG: threonylcarbamoyl-AMP synthase [Legionellales bacterium RIFCSPHIGHO2_12_FULL_37_14]|nr:MAG: threonylcarbamoyl-AMP synthase [Legionellales bacterium RIFCSPHIGHO2_12_FULL_37_14]
MVKIFAIHKDNPQARLLRQAKDIILAGGIVVYPTDSGYALGCRLCDKNALERIRQLRQLDKSHNMTLLCRDLSSLSQYANVTNPIFRLLRAFTPGSYTFILKATRQVPKLMLHPQRKTLGLRVPDHSITLALLECLEAPLVNTSLTLPGALVPLSEPEAIRDILGSRVDLIIEGGSCDPNPTTVVDLTGDYPVIIRKGKGATLPFE